MSPLIPVFRFVFHIGYFGPFVMGVLDSSFLVLPFGNDLLVVGLVARNHHGTPWYVLSAAVGSTMGALLLDRVCHHLGEGGLRKLAGESRYEKLKSRITRRAGLAVAVAGLAPPPFPFTTVIAALGALDYSLWRLLLVNFLARGLRFTVLALLALRYGRTVLAIAKSEPFRWSMLLFILLCIVGSGFSIWRWLKQPRRHKPRGKTA